MQFARVNLYYLGFCGLDYKPTRYYLEAIQSCLIKERVFAFDEPSSPKFPIETISLSEVRGFKKHSIRREISNRPTSYLVIE